MIKAAVTGSLCSGKSTLCSLLREKGADVVDADSIVHDLLENDDEVKTSVIQLLGNQVIRDGKIDRARVADAVFVRSDLLEALERILHPAVRKAIDAQAQVSASPLFVAEIPLLFEGGKSDVYDVTIAVLAPYAERRARYLARHPDRNDFDVRDQRQMPQSEKSALADYTINNDEGEDVLRRQVESLWRQLFA